MTTLAFGKTKVAFTSDNALSKLAFLAIQNMEKSGIKPPFSRELLGETFRFIRTNDYFWRQNSNPKTGNLT